ncbi:MAG: glycerate kinase [Desulfosarcina sp.]|nr:glycerate kinase [Desulfosarcina sp.]MBC2744759.1 glycerate kinase [Desulfosarcina sp.]MBC2767667.1 glycerate kinase [Desulfosarcina sp.]
MRIVVAPNAFKGSLSAMEAAEAMKKGILSAIPQCDVTCVPVADGGDGLTEVMLGGLGGKRIETTVSGPRMEPLSAPFCMVSSRKLAVVEMAKASGLALLSKDLHDPTRTTTYGTGEMIRAAMDSGATRIIVGIGGSATCDGGIGMASALGFRFLDKNGAAVEPVGGSLEAIASIDRENIDPRLDGVSLSVACDVTNPLIGENGAATVYSPQKGATPEQVTRLEAGLANLARVIQKDLGVAIADMPGAGAAGGLGGGLHAFVGAELKPGIDLVVDVVGLKDCIADADLVLTAEGRIDDQTRFNKAPAGVARTAKAAGVPCVAICGGVGEGIESLYDIGIDAVFSICSGPQSLAEAMQDASDLLARCTEQVVRAFLAGRSGQ